MLLSLAAKKKSSLEELCSLARNVISRFQGTVFLFLQCFKILWHLTEQFPKILHWRGIVKKILKLMSGDLSTASFFSFTGDPYFPQSKTMPLTASEYYILELQLYEAGWYNSWTQTLKSQRMDSLVQVSTVPLSTPITGASGGVTLN